MRYYKELPNKSIKVTFYSIGGKLMDVTVFIKGDENEEHFTYVGNNKEQCYGFYSDGYDGIKSKEVINFLKFLGYEPFVIHNNKFVPGNLANQNGFC